MSGHSKWANIKNKKAKVDAQRGVVFQKFAREIITASRLGGPDPAGNFRLRTAIDRAKAAGLPNDNIKRAIEKGCGGAGSDNFEEITYEGYGAGGAAIFIEAMTDNRNRTAGDIRSFFSKFNGNLGESGCVGWIFKPVGLITFDKEDVDFDKLFEAAIEFNADDVKEEEDEYQVVTTFENLQACSEGLDKAGFKAKSAEFTRLPENSIEITDAKTATNILRLMEKLEDHDDVQNVYSNFDISDELMSQLDI
ncbi:MAG: YebC/PmpR family DNA-binding transcriptional regulator [Candidatus Gastranaerophilaceae bacterium]